jgi:DNA-binding CsgD family transcriptional regulator
MRILPSSRLEHQLEALGGEIHGSLEEHSVPMYVVDRRGKILWLNAAGQQLLPGAEGRTFTDVLAADRVHPARRHFALRMLGREEFKDHETELRTPGGGRRGIEISSVPLRRGRAIVGVFGVMRAQRRAKASPARRPHAPDLTPRQHEVLRLLGAGMTTRQMADEMGLSTETVRNHVRSLLRQLRAKSRLEAVLAGHRFGLLTWPDAEAS